jgi:hypothetical protein
LRKAILVGVPSGVVVTSCKAADSSIFAHRLAH